MKTELFERFNSACDKAKVISTLPNLSEEQYSKIFSHVSNTDMMTTIKTINFAYRQIVDVHKDSAAL